MVLTLLLTSRRFHIIAFGLAIVLFDGGLAGKEANSAAGTSRSVRLGQLVGDGWFGGLDSGRVFHTMMINRCTARIGAKGPYEEPCRYTVRPAHPHLQNSTSISAHTPSLACC